MDRPGRKILPGKGELGWKMESWELRLDSFLPAFLDSVAVEEEEEEEKEEETRHRRRSQR